MPISEGASEHRHRLIRRVLGVRGEMRFRVDVQPRFDYGREKHETIFHEAGVLFRSPQISLALETRVPMDFAQDGAYGEFTLRPGETATFVLEQVPETLCPAQVLGGRDARGVRGDGALLAPLAVAVPLPGALARDDLPLGADAQADDLPPDGRDRGRADDEPARAHRRSAELRLPLHVDPRRGLLAVRAPAARLHRGGLGVHGVADRALPRGAPGRRRPAPDHVRDRRRARARGGDPRPPRGLPRLEARPDRQRRGGPAPARHLRRADRLGLPLQQPREPDRAPRRGWT